MKEDEEMLSLRVKGWKYKKEKEESVSEQRHELAKSFGYQVDGNSDDAATASNLGKKEMEALK